MERNRKRNTADVPTSKRGNWRDRKTAREDDQRSSAGVEHDSFKSNPRARSTSGNARTSRQNGPNKGSYQPFHHRQQNMPTSNSHLNRDSDHNNRKSGQQSSNRSRNLGFKFFEDLLDKSPEEIVMKLSGNHSGLELAFKSDIMTNDLVFIIVELLRKVCESSFEMKIITIRKILDGSFYDKLLSYINMLYLQNTRDRHRNQYFWKDMHGFWYNLIGIYTCLLNISPNYACEILPKLVRSTITTIPIIEVNLSVRFSDEIKTKLENIGTKLKLLLAEFEKNKAEQTLIPKPKEYEEPPNDFREISIYPDIREITVRQFAFLRENVIEGSYRDVNHYLDVQFRLLREDFVAPLREGITTFLSKDKKRIQNVKLSRDVIFLKPEVVNEQNCYRVCFDTSGKKKSFKYENSRRFMFGSLVCFTSDNFRTVMFGKIAERKVEDLEKGEVIIGFDTNRHVVIEFAKRYLMVECSVYFEPYYHVLQVLKTFNIERFPMEKYIIKVENTPHHPRYMTPETVYSIKGVNFFPLNWPDRIFFGLNESQNKAFRAALTQEFAVIQGPPGTGKTFLGLKIAETLLKNSEVWYQRTPMLVICYTNHALDQFLEGLLPITTRIIRVGGQSKNDALEQFNLRKRKRDHRPDHSLFAKRDEVRSCLGKLRQMDANLSDMERFDCIFDFRYYLPNYSTSSFWNSDKNAFLSWLICGTYGATGRKELDQVMNGMANINIAEDGQDQESDKEEVEDIVGIEFFDHEIFGDITTTRLPTLISLSELEKEYRFLEREIASMEYQEDSTELEHIIKLDQIRQEIFENRNLHNLLSDKLQQGKQGLYKQIQNFNVDPRSLSVNKRWDFYFSLMDMVREKFKRKREERFLEYQDLYKEYNMLRDIEDVTYMRKHLVIGMTTTSAARLHSSLQALESAIVIVEEAAEVLEAHVVTSLTPHCQHLILIGDHKQLKPSTSDYRVEKKYLLGISLFERMVSNKIQYNTLNVQHRMRPSISALITPSIYPDLKDHPSVLLRPNIVGVDKPLFFIDHNHPEEQCSDESKKNPHEACFLICLARHLILNGYEAEDITILAAYLGQMYEMQREKKKCRPLLDGVRIAVLDNYQGEECEIILLSLVRSNSEKRIGFLNIENRVCVALSRARTGFYIMGDMTHLCGNNNTNIWPEVKKTLEKQDAIGPALRLRCQIHIHNVTLVKCADDFKSISEGGCKEYCGKQLVCGHTCPSLCHVKDRDHNKKNCTQPCRKLLCEENEKHICLKRCYEECGPCTYPVKRTLNCGHTVDIECSSDPETYACKILVPTKLPCGHEAEKPCYKDPILFRCPHPCDTQVDCGHACVLKCHIRDDPDHLQYTCTKPCGKIAAGCKTKGATEGPDHMCRKRCYEECNKCMIPVKKHRTVCLHVFTLPCSEDTDSLTCHKPCKKLLNCGHPCKNQCHEECGPCAIKVEKEVPECHHKIKVRCSVVPSRSLCTKKCPLNLPCGHRCTEKCCKPCTTTCRELVDCSIPSPCGHIIKKIYCHLKFSFKADDSELIKFCTEPCNEILACEHPCSGTCSECSQGRFHKRCQQKCGAIQICNHECDIPCRNACKPCTRPCEYSCPHSKCKKRCGQPCTPCKEDNCPRRCPHQKCSRKCGDKCSVPPCEEPCMKMLVCGHQCAGFCGDPCPNICLICDKDEVENIMMILPTDNETNPRFIVLRDCNHIFENSGMNEWLKQDDNEIKIKVCPVCKTPIIKTLRYSDYVKETMIDIQQVKAKEYGSATDNEKKRKELLTKISQLESTGNVASILDFQPLRDRLNIQRKGRRQAINAKDLSCIESKLQIVTTICNIKVECKTNTSKFDDYAKLIIKKLTETADDITAQEIADYNCELKRLSHLVPFLELASKLSLPITNTTVRSLYEEAQKLIYGNKRFTEESGERIKVVVKHIQELMPSMPLISQTEIKEVVRAIGGAAGHWFKCPNGHLYHIDACGGAMEVGKCNECGARIGGTNHQLLGDNAHSNIDGSSHPAWPEQANLLNYRMQF